MGYTTADLVKSEIRAATAFASTTIPSLSEVTTWIEEESAIINHDLGTSAASTARTSVLDYNGEEYLTLKMSPIISVSSVLYATSELGTSDYNTSWVNKTEGVDYTVYTDEGTIYLLPSWNPSEGMKRIKVYYTSGYSSTPLEIQMLCTKRVAMRVLKTLIQSNVATGSDGGSISVGSISIVEPSGIGINSVKELKSDIQELEKKLTSGSVGVYRFERI